MSGAEVTGGDGAPFSLEEGMGEATAMILSLTPAALATSANALPKALLIGNGGSAAIVSHVQNDLCKALGIPAMVFNEPPLLTALANDDGYETVFRQMAELWARPGDLFIAVSSSGNSEYILSAVEAASSRGCKVLTFSGFSPDNPLRRMGDLNFYVASDFYGFVEVAHMALAHFMTDNALSRRSEGKESR